MKKYRFFVDKNFFLNEFFYLFFSYYCKIHDVLKLKIGDIIFLFNNYNYEVKALIVKYGKDYVVVKKLEIFFFNKDFFFNLNLGYVISKNIHMDFVIQKATELGVANIVPLLSKRISVFYSSYVLKNKMAHWNSIIIDACRQSGRNNIPFLSYPVSLYRWVEYLTYVSKNVRTTNIIFSHDINDNNNICYLNCSKFVNLIIGPEGGFSNDELFFLEINKFRKISLGTKILRTETAVVSSVASLQLFFGNM